MNAEPFDGQTFKENVQEAGRAVNALKFSVFRRDMEQRQEPFQVRAEVAMVIEWFFMVTDPQQVPVWATLGLIPAWNKPDDFRSDLCLCHCVRPL